MMNESLVSSSFNRFKKNMPSYIAVGIFCGLFLVLASILSFIDESAFLIAIPILVLPFLFASHISCYLLELEQPINVGAFFRYYTSFFRPQFRGSFRGLMSFLKSLAVYGVFLSISLITFFVVFQNQYGDTFLSSIKEIVTQYLNGGLTTEELYSILNANDGMLLTFLSFAFSTPLPFAITAFIYFISFSSIALYYRANVASGVPSLLRIAIGEAYSKARKEMRKDWFKLNWPLLVLSLAGSITGGLICALVFKKYLFLAPAFTMCAFILIIFFLPFYFSNMESLYIRYENVFKEGNKKAIEVILSRIQNSIGLSEEEKRKLEESFKEENEEKE